MSEAHGGHNVVVAVGGYSTQSGMLDTAEIYDPLNPEAGWVESKFAAIFLMLYYSFTFSSSIIAKRLG